MKREASPSPAGTPTKTPRGSKYYRQAYRKEWESMSDFKGWLTEVKGHPQRAYCIVCSKSLHAHRLSLLKHTVTLRHTTAALKHFRRANTDQQEEPKIIPILSNPETSSSAPVSVPTITVIDPKAFMPTKVQAKRTIITLLRPAKSVLVKEREIVLEEELNCDETVKDHSLLRTALQNSEEQMKEDHKVEVASSTLDEASEQESKAQTVDYPEPVTPPSPPVAKLDLPVKKTVKPIDEYPISTHVLDTAKGTPVGNLHVSLYKLVDGRWTALGEGVTTPDGRCNSFIKRPDFLSGRYKLHFDVDRYFEIRKQDSLYPFIEIVFDARSSMDHYHVPLLLSPFGYTTYRGS